MNDETLVKNEFYIELAALKGLNPKKLSQGELLFVTQPTSYSRRPSKKNWKKFSNEMASNSPTSNSTKRISPNESKRAGSNSQKQMERGPSKT